MLNLFLSVTGICLLVKQIAKGEGAAVSLIKIFFYEIKQ